MQNTNIIITFNEKTNAFKNTKEGNIWQEGIKRIAIL